jgi:hypothetical protein
MPYLSSLEIRKPEEWSENTVVSISLWRFGLRSRVQSAHRAAQPLRGYSARIAGVVRLCGISVSSSGDRRRDTGNRFLRPVTATMRSRRDACAQKMEKELRRREQGYGDTV